MIYTCDRGDFTDCSVPERFPSPFDLEPHPLAQSASFDLQKKLLSISTSDHSFFSPDGGKMFGVLVAQKPDTSATMEQKSHADLVYLAAFSGMLAGEWVREGFAPPVFSVAKRRQVLDEGEVELAEIAKAIETQLRSPQRSELQEQLSAILAQQQQALSEAALYFQKRRAQRHDVRHNHQTVERGLVGNLPLHVDLALQSQRDKSEYKALKSGWARRVATIQSALDEFDQTISANKQKRKALSRTLQEQLFFDYRLPSYSGKKACVTEFFSEAMPPGGTGDCASIKLLCQCYALKLKPVCMAEFWWGASPPGGVRHHGQFYPACRGKCRPVLPHMLHGLDVESPRFEAVAEFSPAEPRVVYEDEHLLVLIKPAGMLSVPGKVVSDSVELRLQSRYPELVPKVLSRMLVHRLDQATSGLMVAARSAVCHKALHQQFERREVTKRYIAVVNGTVAGDAGVIDLPLRVDLDDRPRQMVCYQHGKPAETHFQVLSRTSAGTRLQLFPVTGRTHQLRVHLAHPAGLNAPIKGDELYGIGSDRLYLHAERLSFRHPVTGEKLSFESSAPF